MLCLIDAAGVVFTAPGLVFFFPDGNVGSLGLTGCCNKFFMQQGHDQMRLVTVIRIEEAICDNSTVTVKPGKLASRSCIMHRASHVEQCRKATHRQIQRHDGDFAEEASTLCLAS